MESPSALLSISLKKLKTKPTPKKYVIFEEMKLSSFKIKKLSIFQERACKAWKSKISHFLFAKREFSNISAKEKSFSYFPL